MSQFVLPPIFILLQEEQACVLRLLPVTCVPQLYLHPSYPNTCVCSSATHLNLRAVRVRLCAAACSCHAQVLGTSYRASVADTTSTFTLILVSRYVCLLSCHLFPILLQGECTSVLPRAHAAHQPHSADHPTGERDWTVSGFPQLRCGVSGWRDDSCGRRHTQGERETHTG